MCDTCGCGDATVPALGHHHDHEGESTSGHSHGHTHIVGEPVLDLNARLARENADFFRQKGIFCLNLLSSPGSGKTTLLEHLLREMGHTRRVAVIEGDQQTHFDAARIRKVTPNVTQINTNRGCHLDAHMVRHALSDLDLDGVEVLFVENVGNLVCPSMFELGEALKVVILSVTEGDDKPLKYPNAFFESGLAIISKTDLLPYVDFDMARCREYIGRVNPGMRVIAFSAKTGEGLAELVAWIERARANAQGAAVPA